MTTCITTNTQLGRTYVEKVGRVGGSFVRFFTKNKSLSRDTLEILFLSWRKGKEKR